MVVMARKDTTRPAFQGDIMDMVGGNGPWQWIIFGVIIVLGIPTAMNNLVMSFYAPNLEHWCARPEGSNWTLDDWKNYGLPQQDQECSRYDIHNFTDFSKETNNSTLKVIQCDSWEYDETLYGSTLLSKWNLVCNREWLVSMSKSIFICGNFFSVSVFGYFSDQYGRKPIFFVCTVITLFFSLGCAFSTSFLMFAVCRFFVAVGVMGADNSCFVLRMEALGPKYRSYYGIAINFGWCIGYLTLPLIVWLIKDWFWIQIVITVPCVLLVSSWWLLPESPRWLLTKGKDEKAIQALLAAGKRNGMAITNLRDKIKETFAKTSKGYEVKQSFGSILHLVISSGIWKQTLVIFYLWFMTAFVYYGLTYNTNELAGDPYINFAASGAIEIPAYTLTIFIIASLGRKRPQGVSLGCSGIACLLMLIIPQEPWWLGLTMSMIGKFCISAAFAILYIYTAEIFPTSVRAISMGSASMSGKIGSVIAPFVKELSHFTYPAVPQVVFGILAMIGGALVVFLPETHNISVPNTLGEAIAANRKEEKKLNGTEDTII